MLVLWFRVSTCLRFWSKTSTKRCTNNSLLSHDNTVSSLLELIYYMLSISEYILKKQLLSILIKKTYTKRYTNNYAICDVSKAYTCGWLSAFNSRYDLGNGRMRCKQKYWIKNMAAKTPVEILFRFCLLCQLSIAVKSCFNYMCPCGWF